MKWKRVYIDSKLGHKFAGDINTWNTEYDMINIYSYFVSEVRLFHLPTVVIL